MQKRLSIPVDMIRRRIRKNRQGLYFVLTDPDFYVKWNQVEEYMHTESREKAVSKEKQTVVYELPPVIDEEELRMIF